MKAFLRLFLCLTAVAALAGQSLRNEHPRGRLHSQIRSLQTISSWRVAGLQKRELMKKTGNAVPTSPSRQIPTPQTLKKAPLSSVRGFSGLTPLQGPSSGAKTLERTSSKRKDPEPQTGPPSQRPRILGPSGNKGDSSTKSNTKPLGKPPLHPSFKNSPEYKVKMERAAALKEASARRKRISDTSFLSDFAEHHIDDKKYPEPEPWIPPRPLPFRSQLVDHSPGRFIPIS